MRKVLFYYDNQCGEGAKGGTEIATYRIAKALNDTQETGVYNAYRNSTQEKTSEVYSDSIKLSKNRRGFIKGLSEFIKKNEIDIIVNMGRFFRHGLLDDSIKVSGRNVKLIFMHHFAPGSEIKKSTFKSGIHLLKLNPFNPLYWLRSSIYPIIKMPRRYKYPDIYKQVYERSDRVVLLCDGYAMDYCMVGNFTDNSKFVAIQNIFDNFSPSESSNSPKKKRVLILSRMDEIQKRLSLALKVWTKIENDTDLSEWHLDIVGGGHNTDIVKRMVRKLGLKRVTLHGWKPREEFLGRASILMMTSEYEGLPLTILEAQATGCVPIAYNSFSSLSTVIEAFENGVVVNKFGDIDEYVAKLKDLMYDEEYRNELSNNARKTINRFSSEKIAKEWLKILT